MFPVLTGSRSQITDSGKKRISDYFDAVLAHICEGRDGYDS